MDCHGAHPKPGRGPELKVAPFHPLRGTWPEGALPPPQRTAPPGLLHACNVLMRSTCTFGRTGLEILVHESSSTYCTELGRSRPDNKKTFYPSEGSAGKGRSFYRWKEKPCLPSTCAPPQHLTGSQPSSPGLWATWAPVPWGTCMHAYADLIETEGCTEEFKLFRPATYFKG